MVDDDRIHAVAGAENAALSPAEAWADLVTRKIAGLVDQLDAEIYHATRALSAGGAHTLLGRCPAAFHHELTAPRDDKLEFDIGTAVHFAVLEPERLAERVVAVSADDWRTKAARELRDEARAVGKTPLLARQLAQVHEIRAILMADETARRFLDGAVTERSLIWSEGGTLCKCRPDAMPAKGAAWIADVKAVSSVHPRAFARKAYDMGWHMRASWYLAGAEAVMGEAPERYVFVAVESTPPHLVACYELDDHALHWGGLLNREALALYRHCMRTGKWPGYPAGVSRIALPAYADFQLEEMRTAAAERGAPPVTSMEFYRPL